MRAGVGHEDESGSRFNVVLAASVCLTGTMLPLAVVFAATASPASAATTGVPRCPPDCGAVAAGDPLLVPFMTANPGVDWQAFPAADSQSYVNSLRRNVRRLAGTSASTNVAAARWE